MIDWPETRLRLQLWLHRAWPFRVLAWVRSRGVPESEDFGEFGDNQEPCRFVEAMVCAVIPEFNQVHVESSDGRQYAITAKTAGVDSDELQVGRRLQLTVDDRGRVMHAALIGDRPDRPVPTLTPAQIALHGGITESKAFSLENAENMYALAKPMSEPMTAEQHELTRVKAQLADAVDILKAREAKREERFANFVIWGIVLGMLFAFVAAVAAIVFMK